MKLKSALLATTASLALPAFAAIAPATTGDGELFLAVYDSTAKVSYTLDLGITLSAFRAAADGAASLAGPGEYGKTWLVDDANFTSFMAQSSMANTRWAVMAADSSGAPTAPGNQRLLTTVAAGTSETTMKQTINQKLTDGLGAAQMGNFFNAVNVTGTHGAVGVALDYSVNGSSVNAEADTGRSYFGESGGTSATLNNNLRFSAGNMLGASSDFYYVTQSSSSPGSPIALDRFDNKWGAASFALAQDAGGQYALTYAVAVPEPETYALMLLGLAAVGAIARRRKAG